MEGKDKITARFDVLFNEETSIMTQWGAARLRLIGCMRSPPTPDCQSQVVIVIIRASVSEYAEARLLQGLRRHLNSFGKFVTELYLQEYERDIALLTNYHDLNQVQRFLNERILVS